MSTRRKDRRKDTRRDSGRAVTITLRMDPAGQVTLTIRDTRIGLPADGEVHVVVEFGPPLSRGWIHLMRPEMVLAYPNPVRPCQICHQIHAILSWLPRLSVIDCKG